MTWAQDLWIYKHEMKFQRFILCKTMLETFFLFHLASGSVQVFSSGCSWLGWPFLIFLVVSLDIPGCFWFCCLFLILQATTDFPGHFQCCCFFLILLVIPKLLAISDIAGQMCSSTLMFPIVLWTPLSMVLTSEFKPKNCFILKWLSPFISVIWLKIWLKVYNPNNAVDVTVTYWQLQ